MENAPALRVVHGLGVLKGVFKEANQHRTAVAWTDRHGGSILTNDWSKGLPPEQVIDTQEKIEAMRKRWGLAGVNLGGYVSASEQRLHLSGINYSMDMLSKVLKELGLDLPDARLGQKLIVAAGKTGRGAAGAGDVIAAAHFALEQLEEGGRSPTINITKKSGLVGAFAHEYGHFLDVTNSQGEHFLGGQVWAVAAHPYWRQVQDTLSNQRAVMENLQKELYNPSVTAHEVLDQWIAALETEIGKTEDPAAQTDRTNSAANALETFALDADMGRTVERLKELREQLDSQLSGHFLTNTPGLLKAMEELATRARSVGDPLAWKNLSDAMPYSGDRRDGVRFLPGKGPMAPRYPVDRTLTPTNYYAAPTEVIARSFERVVAEVIREKMPDQIDHPLMLYLINKNRVAKAGSEDGNATNPTAYPADEQFAKDMKQAWAAALPIFFSDNIQDSKDLLDSHISNVYVGEEFHEPIREMRNEVPLEPIPLGTLVSKFMNSIGRPWAGMRGEATKKKASDILYTPLSILAPKDEQIGIFESAKFWIRQGALGLSLPTSISIDMLVEFLEDANALVSANIDKSLKDLKIAEKHLAPVLESGNYPPLEEFDLATISTERAKNARRTVALQEKMDEDRRDTGKARQRRLG